MKRKTKPFGLEMSLGSEAYDPACFYRFRRCRLERNRRLNTAENMRFVRTHIQVPSACSLVRWSWSGQTFVFFSANDRRRVQPLVKSSEKACKDAWTPASSCQLQLNYSVASTHASDMYWNVSSSFVIYVLQPCSGLPENIARRPQQKRHWGQNSACAI